MTKDHTRHQRRRYITLWTIEVRKTATSATARRISTNARVQLKLCATHQCTRS